MVEEKYINSENHMPVKNLTIQFTSSMLYDRLRTLSDEYAISEEFLINAAVKRLVDDVDFLRSLRAGKIELE